MSVLAGSQDENRASKVRTPRTLSSVLSRAGQERCSRSMIRLEL